MLILVLSFFGPGSGKYSVKHVFKCSTSFQLVSCQAGSLNSINTNTTLFAENIPVLLDCVMFALLFFPDFFQILDIIFVHAVY